MKIIEKHLFNNILFFILAFVLVLLIPLNAKAANGTVTFGSESYEKQDGESFPIGIYVRGETDISEYRVELKYDSKRLKYLTGAEEVNEEEGLLTFYGNMNGAEEAKLWLELQAQSGGEVTLEVVNASAKNSLGEEYTMTELSSVKVVLNGEDKFAAEEQALREAEEQARLEAEEQARLEAEEQARLEAEEQARLEAEEKERQEKLQAEKEKEENDSEQTESDTKKDKKDKNEKTGTIVFPKKAIVYIFLAVALIFVSSIIVMMILGKRKGNSGIDLTKSYAGESDSKTSRKYVFDESDDIEMIDFDSTEYDILTENEEIPAEEANVQANEESNTNQTTSVESILSENDDVSEVNKISKADNSSEKNTDESDKNNVSDSIEALNAPVVEDSKDNKENSAALNEEENAEQVIQNNVPLETELGEPIIKVDDVTMRFKISTSNASGIKEYLIQRLKRQVSYRELLALDHVSFDVFKGEVVGIIGTNGSGKSTLLKIVSGALEPTSGKVYVDRRKIQLLTLGTGFDMELSARENVYLNGSIIGYSKEFIDKHYARIVKFAELDGFMEEKVKNFSSGMVSRLGFAIATAGEAAEILILDEVLSVGDEFFRKKSLKRIKEMIHGGSTVIMVSHGMNTILDNCTKVVWIEKGKLRMVGEPKTVCSAYRDMEKEKENEI